MRKLHRWASGACLLLLAWVSLTGTLLSLDGLVPPPGVGGRPGSPGWRLPAHNLLKELHTGSFIGLTGRTIDLLTGAAFAFLAVSGTVMYLQMRSARRAQGRGGWFWR